MATGTDAFNEAFDRACSLSPSRSRLFAAKRAMMLNRQSNLFGDRHSFEADDLMHRAYLWLYDKGKLFDPTQWPGKPSAQAAYLYLCEGIVGATDTERKRLERRSAKFGCDRQPHQRGPDGELHSPIDSVAAELDSAETLALAADCYRFIAERSPKTAAVVQCVAEGLGTDEIGKKFGRSDSWVRKQKTEGLTLALEYYGHSGPPKGDT
jgi:DNA-directed RNA polymerase specialized sigma24 family protein